MSNTPKEKEVRELSVQLNLRERTLLVVAEDGTVCAVKVSKNKTQELNNLMGMNTCS